MHAKETDKNSIITTRQHASWERWEKELKELKGLTHCSHCKSENLWPLLLCDFDVWL